MSMTAYQCDIPGAVHWGAAQAECGQMAHESNQAGKWGAQNPGQGTDFFKSKGASDTQAAEAAAAARRAQQGK
jgi:hypothetical protein